VPPAAGTTPLADVTAFTAETPAARPSRRSRITDAALLALLAALMMLPPVGQRIVVTGDEARFVLLARDMLQRSTWFDARVREHRYRNKPPLYPWAIKVLSMPAGRVTETAATLPITLAAIGSVFVTTLLGQRLFTRRAGLWAGLILATSYGFFEHSQMLLPDMIVVVFVVAALYAFWKSIVDPPPGRHLLVFYAMVALGIFAKGPMGLLPLLVAAVWLLTEHGLRGLRRLWTPWGLVVFAVLSAAWLVPFLFLGSRSFARSVVWEDWLSWYFGHTAPFKYLNVLLEAARGFMPWTTIAVLPLLWVRREWGNAAYRFVLLAAILPLLIVLMSHNHRTRYLLPIYPALALLVAWWADTRGAEPSRGARVVAWVSLAGALTALFVLTLPWLQEPTEQTFVDGLWWKAALLGAGTAAMTVIGWTALRAARPALLIQGVAAIMVVMLSVGIWFYNDWVNRSQDFRQLAALIERHAQGGPVRVVGGRFFAIDVYLGRSLTPLRTTQAFKEYIEGPERGVIVLNQRTWNTFPREMTANVEILERLRVRTQVMYVIRPSTRGS
jgi:4-amino-4-deoxy-L-arabinose transferase-like glycosyltransferase